MSDKKTMFKITRHDDKIIIEPIQVYRDVGNLDPSMYDTWEAAHMFLMKVMNEQINNCDFKKKQLLEIRNNVMNLKPPVIL